MTRKNVVIGVSSYSGGGKSSVALRLAEILDHASVIYTDDYDEFSVLPEDYEAWLKQGAPRSAFSRPLLADHVHRLRSGESVAHPVTGEEIGATPFIVFDCPDGRSSEFQGAIDLMVFLDTPLDIAMARRIFRDYYGESQILTELQSKALRSDLDGYMKYGRQAYLEMDKTVKPDCDLILDGTQSVEKLAEQIAVKARSLITDR